MANVGSINFGGLASGLDTKALIDAIMRAERRPLDRLESRQVLLNQRKSALDEMRSKLGGFLNSLRDLSTNRTFIGTAVTVTDESFFKATSRPGADTGLFSVEIFELAAAHKVKSNGLLASDQGLVSDGTITLQSDGNDLITLDVSGATGNNTLEAVRDTINASDAGVQASVLFDGSAHRLIVRSEETGLDNALTITDSTNLGLGDPTNEVSAANDARFEVDGIEITSSSNQITGVIQGVTLDLLSQTTGSPVTFQVEDDVEGVVSGVQSLVKAYNEAIKFFNEQFDRDAPGALSSDGTARRIQQSLQSLVTGGVDGIRLGEIRSLASLGISFDGRTGEMSLSTSTLQELLEERFDEVGRLFNASGTTTDPRITYVSSTSSTQPGEFAVEITQAAEQATVVGSTAISPAGLRDDETLTITVNSQSTEVDLLADADITEVVDTVNAALQSSGVSAIAINDGGALRITATGYGSDQNLSVSSSLADPANGRQSGFDTTPSTDVGVDVAGTIGGVAGTGSGQYLSAAEGEASEGLKIRVRATAADVASTGGDFGTISFSPGLTQRLIAHIEGVTRVGDGTIDAARDVLETDLRRISEEIDHLEERLAGREARLVRTFAEAERALSALQAQQAQLGSIAAF